MKDKSHDVMKALPTLEARVVKLADLATTSHEQPDPVSGFNPKESGHATMAGLFAEWRQDEAARKAPETLSQILLSEGRSEGPTVGQDNDRGIER